MIVVAVWVVGLTASILALAWCATGMWLNRRGDQ